MKRKNSIFVTFFVCLALTMGYMHEAQARRLGGGSSFGSRPSYSQPYQRSYSAEPANRAMRSPSQQQAASQNQAVRQNLANRGGLMGMLGGLALGGLLGSLFFGGAFEHFNFLDILLFAGIAFLLIRLFSARTSRDNQPLGNAYGRNGYQPAENRNDYAVNRQSQFNTSNFETDLLFRKGGPSQDGNTGIPANFDTQLFLTGAEKAFRHLQAAWDNRDLATIRGLSTDKVFAEIQNQLRTSPDANKTEILRLNAELLDVQVAGLELEASVLFESLMKENDGPEQLVKEVWHFIKPVNGQHTKWFLDGIQQLD